MTNFENCSQPAQLVRKPDQLVHEVQFSRIAVRALCLVWIGSRSSKLGINHRLFFWIPDSLRKVLTNFDNFSHLAQLVRKPDQLVHEIQFSRTTVRALCLVWIGSRSS